MKSQAVTKPKRACVLRSVVVGTRRLILYPSFREAFGGEATPDDPLTITKQTAAELSDLSPATINRMVAAGLAETSQENAAA
jgi:hypothetical protein